MHSRESTKSQAEVSPSGWSSSTPLRATVNGLLIVLVTILPYANAKDAIGNAERGREIFLDRELGHCILCHQTSQIDAPFQGNLGPDLSNVAARLTTAEIRAKVADPTSSNPESAMPAFHHTQGLRQVARAHAEKPILTTEQLTDLMAFLVTLRNPNTGAALAD